MRGGAHPPLPSSDYISQQRPRPDLARRGGGGGEMAAWARAVRGLLLDVSGVLYDSGGDGGVPIAGSVEAVRSVSVLALLDQRSRMRLEESNGHRANFV